MTPEVFAKELVARLSEVLPQGFQAYAYDNFVGVSDSGPIRGGVAVDLIVADQTLYDIDLFELVTVNVLDRAQYSVTIGLGTPWPQGASHRPGEMAPPYARRDGDILRMG